MRTRLAVTLLAATAALTGCSSASDDTADRPGNPAVYDRIDGLSDCAALQQEFDTASAGHDRAEPGSDAATAASSYMEAADARMKSLDCY